MFSQFLKLGGQVLAFNDSIQLDNTDINLDGSYGEISDFVMLHRSLTGNGPCSELFDSTSPNVATFTQSTDRARGNETFIDLTSIDSIGAIRFIFDGEITVFSANPSAELDYHYQSNQTTVLLNVKLGHSLDSVFFEQGLLISFIGAGQLIQVEAATNRGFKIVTRIDIASDIADNKPENLPGDFILHQNFPNPFNNRTMINFDLPLASDVKFEILNLLGQTVYRMEKRYSAGSYSIGWDGIDNAGRTVGSGVYYYRIVAGEFVESKKMILLK